MIDLLFGCLQNCLECIIDCGKTKHNEPILNNMIDESPSTIEYTNIK